MIVFYSSSHRQHNPAVEYYDGQATPYAESPARMRGIVEACLNLGLPVRTMRTGATKRQLQAVHGIHYVDFVQQKCATIDDGEQLMPSVFIKDTYTPLTKHTNMAARRAAGLAVAAAEEVAEGWEQRVYALCRPPGHHAEYDTMMGYCYFNNAALAAERLAEGGKRVAILDIDYHHGNGTQQLFYDRADVLYVSIHADPAQAFPYGSGFEGEQGERAGLGFTRNFPLPQTTTPAQYMRTLQMALRVIQEFRPDFVVLSLGFDTYREDPIGNLNIRAQDYVTIGAHIAHGLPLPTVIVQEGGYNVEALGTLSGNFLRGYLGLT